MKNKKIILRALSAVLAVIMLICSAPLSNICQLDFTAITASAASATSGKVAKGIKWSYNKDEAKLTISGKGDIPDMVKDDTDDFTSALFANPEQPWKAWKSKIKSVEIKSGITSIGAFSFYEHKRLEKVTVADTVTQVGLMAFNDTPFLNNAKGAVYAGKNLIAYNDEISTGTVSIKQGTVSIGMLVFSGQGLTSITIPSSVRTIDDMAFWSCDSLKTVNIENGLKKIGYAAFSGCSSLRSITLPKSVKTIDASAFALCGKIKSITLNEGLTSIGEGAFYGCEKVAQLSIPSTVKKIGESAFAYMSGLKKITVKSSSKYFCADKTGVLYNKSKTKLYTYPGANTSTTYKVASSVKTIESNAFDSAKYLTKLVLPKSLSQIKTGAFYGCNNLTSINFPKNIYKISYLGIEGSKWFKALPKGVVYIGKAAYTYKGTMKKSTDIEIKKGTVMICADAFEDLENLKSVKLPAGVKYIGDYAFSGCTKLSNINIPSTVCSIGESAFSYCENLKEITIPAKVTKLGAGAFYECTMLEKITVLNPLCTIETPLLSILGEKTIPDGATVYAAKGSPAISYAKKNGNDYKYLKAVSLDKCTVSSIKDQRYTGKKITPAVTVKYNGTVLKAGKHYTASYTANKKAGTATVTLTGNEKYGFTGSRKVTFKIVK